MWAYPRITILAARRHPGESWGLRGDWGEPSSTPAADAGLRRHDGGGWLAIDAVWYYYHPEYATGFALALRPV